MRLPMLDTITIKGYKSIAAVEGLKLNAINVMIGPNGSGKSNLIGAFAFLQAIRSGRLQVTVGKTGLENLLHFGSKTTPGLDLALSFRDGHAYTLRLESGTGETLLPVEEWVLDHENPAHTEQLDRVGREAGISAATDNPTARRIAAQLAHWQLYHFHDTSCTAPLKRLAAVDDNRGLRPDAGNLAAFLYLLKQRHGTAYDLIRRTVQRVTPFFDDFILEPSALNPDHIKLEWRHRESDQYFDASALSDGTLRFMALATLFLQPPRFLPPVLLVDEPELGLHPFAISLLGALVKRAARDTQIVLATQSPLLLDEFEPDDVLVAERDRHATTLRRLEPDALQEWLQDYSLGELWEKNELGGRPTGWHA